MRCAIENAKIPERVVSFALPLGASANMDGTALYEVVRDGLDHDMRVVPGRDGVIDADRRPLGRAVLRREEYLAGEFRDAADASR